MDQNQIKAGGASINISINSDSVNRSLQLIQKNIKNFVSEAHKTGKIDFSIDPGSAREQLKNILSSLRRFRTEGKESIDSAVESFRELNKKAGSLCDTMEVRLSKSFNTLKTFSLSLIAYLGPFSKFGDNFNKMAGRTGAGTEFLSEMGHAASLCGANLEALEQAFKKMSQDFVAGQNGNKEVIDSYNKLGLSFEYIAALSPEQRFDALRKAIRGIRDPAEQAGMAMKCVFELLGKINYFITDITGVKPKMLTMIHFHFRSVVGNTFKRCSCQFSSSRLAPSMANPVVFPF